MRRWLNETFSFLLFIVARSRLFLVTYVVALTALGDLSRYNLRGQRRWSLIGDRDTSGALLLGRRRLLHLFLLLLLFLILLIIFVCVILIVVLFFIVVLQLLLHRSLMGLRLGHTDLQRACSVYF